MKLFDGTNTDVDKYGAGLDGFQDKNAGGGIGGSKPDETWLGMVQYEIARCITENGGTLATGAGSFPADFSQLYEHGTRPGNAWYGDGSDGAVVVNGADVLLTEDTFATEVEFQTDHFVQTRGYKLFVQGRVYHSGVPGGDWGIRNQGGNASGATGGTGTNLGTTINSPSGPNGTIAAGTAGTGTTNADGGSGGAGGAGNAGAGGAGGIANAPAGVDMRTPADLVSVTTNDRGTVTAVQPGASGGAGAGNGAGNNGGGAGAGGGCVILAARNIELAGTGSINADGGDGGGGTFDSGGGGGGGGGMALVLCRTLDTPAAVTAAGGTAGAGGGGAGVAGVPGVDGLVVIGYV